MDTTDRRTRPLIFVAGFAAAIVLTGGGAAAYAANGGSLLIGRSNFGSATTTLSNSGGTALKLNSKSGTAPLAVNRTTKVTNLNADFLDGRSDASYALSSGQTGVIDVGAEWVDTDEDLVNDAASRDRGVPSGIEAHRRWGRQLHGRRDLLQRARRPRRLVRRCGSRPRGQRPGRPRRVRRLLQPAGSRPRCHDGQPPQVLLRRRRLPPSGSRGCSPRGSPSHAACCSTPPNGSRSRAKAIRALSRKRVSAPQAVQSSPWAPGSGSDDAFMRRFRRGCHAEKVGNQQSAVESDRTSPSQGTVKAPLLTSTPGPVKTIRAPFALSITIPLSVTEIKAPNAPTTWMPPSDDGGISAALFQ